MTLRNRSHRRRSFLAGAALLVLFGAAACGGDDASIDGTSEPATGVTGVDNGDAPAPDTKVSVADALRGIDGPFVITGFFHDDGAKVQLCDALAESFPPQCSQGIAFDNSANVDLGQLTQEGGVEWSDQAIEVEGEIVDGVFVAR